ncbi:hypothetical protein ACQP00_38325 [Dactylosporangium sp. CS-047395]|uniref:hypothetical protein n=1 Tax=Dactylosporangium sp. CS-047395 TaxID=3239936 RepID=UPI003D8FCFCD
MGLSRWVLFVPSISAANDTHRFEQLHFWLGEVLGETVGYALTAAFTVLVVRAVASWRWLAYVGYAAAALIATGVLIPLGLAFASLTNFAGYVLWRVWLIALAAALWRVPRPVRA